MENGFDVEAAVRDRYAAGARAKESALCCPVTYDPALLAAIPAEVVERDYGCGDPTRHVRPGETVLDLGSGSGKACFLASQVVGPTGRVIGVDMNDEMLALARRAAPEVARRVGFSNVEFRKGRIQNLRLDHTWLDGRLLRQPVRSAEDLAALEAEITARERADPLVADGSVDVVVSNCVLNLVRPAEKRALFGEIFRVLRRGGRAIVSDIVCDEDVPPHLQADPELWSGCVSGAFREDELLEAFEAAGFYGITILARSAEPWRVVEGIEFRSITVAAWKGKEGPCWDPTAVLVTFGAYAGLPMSTTHVSSGGIIGLGTASGIEAVRWPTVRRMLAGWVITLPIGAILGALGALLGRGLVGPL